MWSGANLTLPFGLCSIASGLCALAIWMAVNARANYDLELGEFVAREALWPTGPGAVDWQRSTEALFRVVGLLAAAFQTRGFGLSICLRYRLWKIIATMGIGVALLGFMQKLSGHSLAFWPEEEWRWFGAHAFAGFRYHANAAAFLNITWPLTLGFLWCAFRRPGAQFVQAGWLAALIACLSGVFLNVSKAGGVIAVVLLLSLAFAWMLEARGKVRDRYLSAGSRKAHAAVLVLVGVALTAAFLTLLPWDRWHYFVEDSWNFRNPRILVSEITWEMSRDSGWFGFGPGTWSIMFPYYTHEYGTELAGRWRYAHNDYLQTLVEWGWIGTGLWAAWILGGVLTAIKAIRRMRGRREFQNDRRMLIVTLIALGGVFLHAAGDFPLQIFSIQLYVVTLLGICWSSKYWVPDEAAASANRPKRSQELSETE